MYQILLVDDEPVSLELMKKIIEQKCPGFAVAGMAESGCQCLALLPEVKPDIVITDIKMAGMTGIQLVERICEKYPDMIVLAVSGYSEFEYVKAMMKFGVTDYLLKPVVPSEMAEVMERVHKQADLLYQSRRNLILHDRENVDEASLQKYFPSPSYYGILTRKNGLPKRFEKNLHTEIFQEMNEILYYGRDNMETLYLIPSDIMNHDNADAMVLSIRKKEQRDAGYVTTVATREAFPAEMLLKTTRRMYHLLDTRLVNGVSKVMYLEECQKSEQRIGNIKKMLSRFEGFMEAQRKEEAKKELDRLIRYWEDSQIPQLELERIVDYIMVLCADLLEDFTWEAGYKSAYEDVFYSSNSIRDIMHELTEHIFQKEEGAEALKMDTPEFFQSVTRYLAHHMSENMTLKSVGKEFGISQTYLGTLFRKYNHKPFSAFLMELRLEKAREIFCCHPELLIKEVAEMVGYGDQFYFSRIFRAYTGKSPSEYLEEVRKAERV